MILNRAIFSPARLLAAALLTASTLSLFAGCKGNTTSAAMPERAIGTPPSVRAYPATGDIRAADPLSSPIWRNAPWLNLGAPANTTRTTALTSAAVLFDPGTLYVAFISEKQPTPVSRDLVSLYLDTTSAASGTEMVKIAVDEAGDSTCTWIRTSSAAERRPDGSPDFSHPVTSIPDVQLTGLWSRVGEGSHNGARVWTAVVAIPLKNLPLPLRASGNPGTHWKFNLIRNVVSGGGTPRVEQLQANLSPVHVGAQEFAPYRLADLVLAQ